MRSILIQVPLLLGFHLLVLAKGDRLISSTAQAIRSKGFLVKDIFLDVQNGTYVNLVRARNPITGVRSNKLPVLFVHGFLVNANSYILNDVGIKPKDFSHYDPAKMNLKQLKKLLKDEPSSQSLVYLLLNFGYEVWLMNRRPTIEARSFKGAGHLRNSSKIDTKFWNFSFDEQVAHDFPRTVNYVLERTGAQKLDLVTHSSGGLITMAALIDEPKFSKKINKSFFWAPAFNLGASLADPIVLFEIIRNQFVQTQIGPVPPKDWSKSKSKAQEAICRLKLTQLTLCRAIMDYIFGKAQSQQTLASMVTGPRFVDTSSTQEAAQLMSSMLRGKLSYRNYWSPQKNWLAYGKEEPPFYEPSKITLKGMRFYGGLTDRLVRPDTLYDLFDELKVNYSYQVLGSIKTHWNHASFWLHSKIGQMLNIPTLKTLATD